MAKYERRCAGRTQEGRRCHNYVIITPDEAESGKLIYCHHHKEQEPKHG